MAYGQVVIKNEIGHPRWGPRGCRCEIPARPTHLNPPACNWPSLSQASETFALRA